MSALANLGKRMVPEAIRPPLKATRQFARQLTNRGNDVECPCCGGTFKGFLPYGKPSRPAARCQECGALERHRLIWRYIKDETDLLSAPYKVFHSAPEPQFKHHLRRAKNLDYTTADIEAGIADLQVDLTDIHLDDEAFDVLICNHVLEHIVDDRKAMSELYRILKPGGWAIITVPQDMKRGATYEDASIVSPKARFEAFGQSDHVRIYGTDFPSRLRDAGFNVEEIQYDERFSDEERRRYGLTEDGLIYRCSKSS